MLDRKRDSSCSYHLCDHLTQHSLCDVFADYVEQLEHAALDVVAVVASGRDPRQAVAALRAALEVTQ